MAGTGKRNRIYRPLPAGLLAVETLFLVYEGEATHAPRFRSQTELESSDADQGKAVLQIAKPGLSIPAVSPCGTRVPTPKNFTFGENSQILGGQDRSDTGLELDSDCSFLPHSDNCVDCFEESRLSVNTNKERLRRFEGQKSPETASHAILNPLKGNTDVKGGNQLTENAGMGAASCANAEEARKNEAKMQEDANMEKETLGINCVASGADGAENLSTGAKRHVKQKDVDHNDKKTKKKKKGNKENKDAGTRLHEVHLKRKDVDHNDKNTKKKKKGNKENKDAGTRLHEVHLTIEELLDPSKIAKDSLTEVPFSMLPVKRMPSPAPPPPPRRKKLETEVYEEAKEIYAKAKAIPAYFDRGADIAEIKVSPPKPPSLYKRFLEETGKFFARWGKP